MADRYLLPGELARLENRDPSWISHELGREGAPAKTRGGKINLRLWREFRKTRVREDGGALKGPNVDLRRRKLELECRKIEVQIDALLAELVPVQELYAEVDEVVGLLNAGLEEWVQWVTVETRNAALYKKAKAIRDRVKLALKAKCERS